MYDKQKDLLWCDRVVTVATALGLALFLVGLFSELSRISLSILWGFVIALLGGAGIGHFLSLMIRGADSVGYHWETSSLGIRSFFGTEVQEFVYFSPGGLAVGRYYRNRQMFRWSAQVRGTTVGHSFFRFRAEQIVEDHIRFNREEV